MKKMKLSKTKRNLIFLDDLHSSIKYAFDSVLIEPEEVGKNIYSKLISEKQEEYFKLIIKEEESSAAVGPTEFCVVFHTYPQRSILKGETITMLSSS